MPESGNAGDDRDLELGIVGSEGDQAESFSRWIQPKLLAGGSSYVTAAILRACCGEYISPVSALTMGTFTGMVVASVASGWKVGFSKGSRLSAMAGAMAGVTSVDDSVSSWARYVSTQRCSGGPPVRSA